MAYKVRHVVTSTNHPNTDSTHRYEVQEALDQIGENEIYSIQHAVKEEHGVAFSTLIVYRDYDSNDDIPF